MRIQSRYSWTTGKHKHHTHQPVPDPDAHAQRFHVVQQMQIRAFVQGASISGFAQLHAVIRRWQWWFLSGRTRELDAERRACSPRGIRQRLLPLTMFERRCRQPNLSEISKNQRVVHHMDWKIQLSLVRERAQNRHQHPPLHHYTRSREGTTDSTSSSTAKQAGRGVFNPLGK